VTVTANVGLPGTGKTLHAVGHDVVEALKKKRLVVTNVPLNVDALSKFVGFDVSQLIVTVEEHQDGGAPFSKVEDFTTYEAWRSDADRGYGCLFVVDECHNSFAEVVGLNAMAHPITSWFAEHRHKGVDVLLITQARQEIPPAIRRRVERTCEFRKLSALGFSSRYVKLTFHGRSEEALRKDFGKYPAQWFGLYQSRGKGISELAGATSNILLNARLMFVVVGVLGAVFWLMSGDGPSLPGQPAGASNGGATVSTPAPSAPAAAAAPLGVPVATESPEAHAIRDQIAILRAQRLLDRELQIEPPQKLHGQWVQIVGYMKLGRGAEYWLRVGDRRGSVQVIKSGDLFALDYELMPLNECMAWLKSNGYAVRLSCDAPVMVEQLPRQADYELKPVTASE
jgi:zona occludens toxin